MAIRCVYSLKLKRQTVQKKLHTRDQSCDHMVSPAPIQETCIVEFPKRNGKQRVSTAYHFSSSLQFCHTLTAHNTKGKQQINTIHRDQD